MDALAFHHTWMPYDAVAFFLMCLLITLGWMSHQFVVGQRLLIVSPHTVPRIDAFLLAMPENLSSFIVYEN